MKKKIFIYALMPALLGAGFLVTNIASAHGWFGGFGTQTPEQIVTQHQTMFENQAQILGVSVDEVKSAWAAGKTMQELMTEKGITQDQVQTKMKELREQQMKTQLQALVDKGVITQTQADQRLQFMQTKLNTGKGMGHMKHGFRGGPFF